MQAEIPVAHGIILESKALEIDFLARFHVGVERVGIGKLGVVEVIAGFGEDDPFLSNVHADAINRRDVLTEELFLLKRGTVQKIKILLFLFLWLTEEM